MKRIEALADALSSLNSAHEPDSDAYRLRNPGLLRAFTPEQPSDEQGRRIFTSIVDGYQSLLFDLRTKCSGKTRARLLPKSTLDDLLVIGYSQPRSAAEYVRCFLAKALPNITITERTTLAFFLEA